MVDYREILRLQSLGNNITQTLDRCTAPPGGGRSGEG